jgi:V8-like Glu-specific endopeptidase
VDDLKNTVILLGKINKKGKIKPTATGFLVKVSNIIHLVTAKHVIVNPKNDTFIDRDLIAFLNSNDGNIQARSINDIKSNLGFRWIFHDSKEVDVGMIPFPVDMQQDSFRSVPDELFVSNDQFYEVFDVFFISYQPGIKIQRKISPIIRSGTISLMNEGTFFIDAAAFPGNSGSPVFLKPYSQAYTESGLSTIKGGFIGILGQYITYNEAAVSLQTGRVRVMFEENTGLSRVWSISFLKQIVQSEIFMKQIGNIPKELIQGSNDERK